MARILSASGMYQFPTVSMLFRPLMIICTITCTQTLAGGMYVLLGRLDEVRLPRVCDVQPRAARVHRDYLGGAVYHRYVVFHDEFAPLIICSFYLRLLASMCVSVHF